MALKSASLVGRMAYRLPITVSWRVAQCGDLVLRLGVTRGGSISGADLGRSSEYSIGGKTFLLGELEDWSGAYLRVNSS